MKRATRASLIVAVALVASVGTGLGLAGCASGKQEESLMDMSGVYGDWTLAAFGDGTTPSESGRGVFMTVDARGRVFGSGGVNRFSGTLDIAALKAGRFDAAEIVSTKMAGPEAAMRDEARFMELLDRATHWQIDEGTGMVLLDDNGALAVFWRRSAGVR